jgi:hypothetical protein
MSNFAKIVIFDDKTLEDVFKEIYNNNKIKTQLLESYITKLISSLKTPEDMAMLLPVFADYIGTGIKNDEILIKLSAIVQKHETNSGEKEENLISEKEKQEIRNAIRESGKQLKIVSG